MTDLTDNIDGAIKFIEKAWGDSQTKDVSDCLDAAMEQLQEALAFDNKLKGNDEGDKTYEQQHKLTGNDLGIK